MYTVTIRDLIECTINMWSCTVLLQGIIELDSDYIQLSPNNLFSILVHSQDSLGQSCTIKIWVFFHYSLGLLVSSGSASLTPLIVP